LPASTAAAGDAVSATADAGAISSAESFATRFTAGETS
jgi:hypothetical protein